MAWFAPLGNPAVNAAAAECNYVSGWDEAGENELTSREAVTWGAASGGSAAASNQPVLDVAGACTLGNIVLFHDATGGDMLAYDTLDSVVFTEAGTYTLTAMSLAVLVD